MPHTPSFISLEALHKERNKIEEKLALAQALKKNRSLQEQLQKELKEATLLREQLLQTPLYEQQLKAAKKKLEEINKESKQLHREVITKQAAYEKVERSLKRIEKENIALENKQRNSLYQHDRLRTLHWITPLPRAEEITKDTISYKKCTIIHAEIMACKERSLEHRKEAKPLFDKLRKIMESPLDINAFLVKIEEELAGLEELMKVQKEMLQGVQQSLIQPTKSLLLIYQAFQKEIEHFGQQLSEVSVSGIHSLELHLEGKTGLLDDLQKISCIVPEGQLDFHNSWQEGLPILQQYMQYRKEIYLTDLFQLKVRIRLKPRRKAIDLDTNKQMQSYGTDKVLRLIIFLYILRQLLDEKKKNRVVIYIDEIAAISADNIQKILTCCKTCQVLPIFAAPDFIEGFDKYYYLLPSIQNGNKIFLDESRIIDR